jgi:hypothetical protein
MRVINHQAFSSRPQNTAAVRRKRALIIGLAVVAVIVIANGVMAVAYRNKALPGYRVGDVAIGGKSYTEIQKITQENLLPKTVTLTYKDRSQNMSVADLGVRVDQQATFKAIKSKPLLPMLSLVKKTQVPLVLSSDHNTLNTALQDMQPTFSQPATNRHVEFDGTTFVAAAAAQGYRMNAQTTQKTLLKDLAASHTVSTIAVTTVPAGDDTVSVSGDVTNLNKQLQTDIQLKIAEATVTPTKADIGNWYGASGNTMTISDQKLTEYLDATAKKIGVSPANTSDLVLALKYAVPKQLRAHVQVSNAAYSRVKTYCVASKGTSEALLADLTGKLALTYADTRGWNDGGLIAFKHVTSGCSYTVWLTAPALMTSFGEICDDFYNCQVGTNVIVNSDRWQQATEPWRQTGQDLETYRLLIINHETGHRLGFRDNNVCPGAGQPAPVMMQQSIDLKGCVFNTWPLPTELATLKTML